MFIPVGLALGALSSVSSLVQSAASSLSNAGGNDPLSSLFQTVSGEQSPSNPSTGTPPASQFDSGTLATLISLQGQDGKSAASGLFAKIDTDGNGAISKSEFETALSKVGVDTASADAVFNRLDANGDDSVSKSELASARGASFHHHHAGGGSGHGGLSSLLNSTSADGSTTQTTTNSDGSTTTTVTYADGSTVSTTTPAASQNGGSSGGNTGGGSGNLLEKLIQLQSMLISHSTPTTTAVA